MRVGACMSWSRFDDSYYDHPKILEAGPAAERLWTRSIAWSNRHHTDGFIPASAVPVVNAPAGSWRRLASRLVAVGLWESTNSGYKIHDFLEYNSTSSETAAKDADKSAKRSEAGKKGAASRWGKDDDSPFADGKADSKNGKSDGKAIANGWQSDSKIIAPYPIPNNKKEEEAKQNDSKTDGKSDGKNDSKIANDVVTDINPVAVQQTPSIDSSSGFFKTGTIASARDMHEAAANWEWQIGLSERQIAAANRITSAAPITKTEIEFARSKVERKPQKSRNAGLFLHIVEEQRAAAAQESLKTTPAPPPQKREPTELEQNLEEWGIKWGLGPPLPREAQAVLRTRAPPDRILSVMRELGASTNDRTWETLREVLEKETVHEHSATT